MPLDFGGDVLASTGPMMTSSVRMAIEGTSSHVGAPPTWLGTELPTFALWEFRRGNTATPCSIWKRRFLARPPKKFISRVPYGTPGWRETAVNVFARVAREVRQGNPDSTLYDLHLLRHLSLSNRLFEHKLISMDVPQTTGSTNFDREVATRAAELTRGTPSPRQVRVVGHLDMIRHSTRSFEMLLEEGRAVHGVLENGDYMDTLRDLLGQTVLVVGKAVYRPSGSLLRIDAQAVTAGRAESKLFAKIPPAMEHRQATVRYRVRQASKTRGSRIFWQMARRRD